MGMTGAWAKRVLAGISRASRKRIRMRFLLVRWELLAPHVEGEWGVRFDQLRLPVYKPAVGRVKRLNTTTVFVLTEDILWSQAARLFSECVTASAGLPRKLIS